MNNDLTTGSVSRVLIRFALPFLLATLLQMLYGVVDLVVVGQFSNAACITAVNTSGQIMQLITSTIVGIATGGTVLIGQYIGAKRPDDVERTIQTLFGLFTAIAAVLIIVLALATNLLVTLMQVPEEAVIPARNYLHICNIGIPFIAAYNGIASMLRGMGDSRRPMYFVACSCILNILGDLLLVGVLHWGAAGAALATVCSQAVASISAFIYLCRSDIPFTPNRHMFRLERGRVGNILKLGVPLAAQDVLVTLSFVIITAVVNHMDVVNHTGTVQGAAVGVVERLISFCMLVPVSFLHAMSTFAAQNMGARQKERAISGLKMSVVICLGVSFLFFLMAELQGGLLIRLFTPDKDVIAAGATYLHTYGVDILMVCFVFCLNGFFSGCGCTQFTMANGLISTFAVRVPLVFLLSMLPGANLLHIGIAAPVASGVQILIQLWYLRSRRWDRVLIE